MLALGEEDGLEISIHAPREGCDFIKFVKVASQHKFQSTHPARGATVVSTACKFPPFVISIHAPREGCDVHQDFQYRLTNAISIHAPREGCDIIQPTSV